MKVRKIERRFAICITNDEPDLELGKVYRVLPDARAARSNWIRVIDESEEDYLYPVECFAFIQLPPEVRRVIPGRAFSSVAKAPIGERELVGRRGR